MEVPLLLGVWMVVATMMAMAEEQFAREQNCQ